MPTLSRATAPQAAREVAKAARGRRASASGSSRTTRMEMWTCSTTDKPGYGIEVCELSKNIRGRSAFAHYTHLFQALSVRKATGLDASAAGRVRCDYVHLLMCLDACLASQRLAPCASSSPQLDERRSFGRAHVAPSQHGVHTPSDAWRRRRGSGESGTGTGTGTRGPMSGEVKERLETEKGKRRKENRELWPLLLRCVAAGRTGFSQQQWNASRRSSEERREGERSECTPTRGLVRRAARQGNMGK
ncbi:hypothetical protein IWX90DRAFT_21752 [Phyllosticta citrichinensis]|uniref:Uncharacterized protein n=1 Tax=Phyllosticta citrichinensis TaxID=1130410 RepID=A0ABR1Y714_9PEZI